jgi:hypothetical protein
VRDRFHVNSGTAGTIDDEGVFQAMIPRARLVSGARYDIKVVVGKTGDGLLGPPQTGVYVEEGSR